MKHERLLFPCPVCDAWSSDDEVCDACGAKLPAEYSEEGYFVPGYDKMTEEERAEVDKKIEQLSKERAVARARSKTTGGG